jgi:hypothetical protein
MSQKDDERIEAAKEGLGKVFREEFNQWELKRDGRPELLTYDVLPFSVKVRRHDIDDGLWERYKPIFAEAARSAALSSRRLRDAKLDDALVFYGSKEGEREDVYVWHVVQPSGG